jgi:hypothetical protein
MISIFSASDDLFSGPLTEPEMENGLASYKKIIVAEVRVGV